MPAKSNFWLHVYGLAMDLDLEGSSDEERLRNIAEAFHSMPAASQEELRRELDVLCVTLPQVSTALPRPQAGA